MTNQEYLNKFQIFYNNIDSNQAPGLIPEEIQDITNEAYKSLIVELYSSSFEQSEEVRRYLASLIDTVAVTLMNGYYNTTDLKFYETYEGGVYSEPLEYVANAYYKDILSFEIYKCIATITEEETTYSYNLISDQRINKLSYIAETPDNTLFITYESAKDDSSNSLIVVPVTQDTLYKVMEDPFKSNSKKRVLRLDTGNHKVELVAGENVLLSSYILRYLKEPTKIDLTTSSTLSSELCSLPDVLQTKLLFNSVQLAKSIWAK